MTCWAAGRSSWRSARNLRVQLLDVNIRRHGSNSASQQDKAAKRTPLRPEPSSTHDWIGPPNPLSNLRPIIYRVPEEESELERRLRNLRQETEDWNHKFWTQQNLNFSKEKEAFLVSQLAGKGLTLRDVDGRRRSLSSEEMAVFYKSFLDKNRKHHASYNKTRTSDLWPAVLLLLGPVQTFPALVQNQKRFDPSNPTVGARLLDVDFEAAPQSTPPPGGLQVLESL